jgi:nucleoside-diphosphate-sugar epimerase
MRLEELAGRRVLVTGGTGFIGGRLVEKLVIEHGARVRVLTSNFAHAARIARFDLEIVQGDVADGGTVSEAAAGCAAVFHCAYGARGSEAERRRVTVESTRAVLDAAVSQAVPRVVVVSSMVVYGTGVEGRLDERSPHRPSGIVYADAKIEADALALEYAARRGVGVSVVQPTAVYGPFAPSWTVRVLTSLRTGTVILVDGGVGYANPVYVDDVVDAILLAAVREGAVGEAFLISSGESVTWRRFFERHEAMLGYSSTTVMSAADAKAYYANTHRRKGVLRELMALVRDDPRARARIAATREATALYPLLKRFVPGSAIRAASRPTPTTGPEAKRIHPEHPKQVDFLAARTDVVIDKARRVLGYEPAYDLDRGMAVTEAWARWANLLPAKEAS